MEEPSFASAVDGIRAGSPRRLLIVAAHPDDETIGAGALLGHAADTFVVHLTDGAPAASSFWPPGVASRSEYAAIRRRELVAAMALSGLPAERLRWLGAIDQEGAHALVPASRSLAELLDELQPDLVLTHAYEGGHPDHDAAAFVTRAAVRLRGKPVTLGEMTSYHELDAGLVTGRFLPGPTGVVEHRLDAEDAARKRRMLDTFASQEEILRPFGVEAERFRAAPPADFARPPHPGLLHHERLGWVLTGAQVRALAVQAARLLGFGDP